MTVATASNIRWGPHLTDVFDYALHPTRDGGAGNPLLIWRHTGGGGAGSKAQLWDGPHYEMNKLLEYFMSASRDVHFDVVSVESDQYTFFEAGQPVPRSFRVMYPGVVSSYQRSIRNIKAIMQPLGSDPARVGLMGASHGGWLTLMSQLMPAEFSGSAPRADARRRFDAHGFDHRCKLMWLWSLAYPDWRKIASATGITFTGATVSGTSVTKTSGFTNYRFTTGDTCVLTSGATPGTYTIASRTNNDTIVLATSAGSGTAAGYVSTDQTDLRWSTMLFGTKVNGTSYAEWDALPERLRNAVSPQYWAEQGQIDLFPPSFFSSSLSGDGIHPYGNLYNGSSDIHDYHGAQDLSAALAARGSDSTFRSYSVGVETWTSLAEPAIIYDWMVARINA